MLIVVNKENAKCEVFESKEEMKACMPATVNNNDLLIMPCEFVENIAEAEMILYPAIEPDEFSMVAEYQNDLLNSDFEQTQEEPAKIMISL